MVQSCCSICSMFSVLDLASLSILYRINKFHINSSYMEWIKSWCESGSLLFLKHLFKIEICTIFSITVVLYIKICHFQVGKFVAQLIMFSYSFLSSKGNIWIGILIQALIFFFKKNITDFIFFYSLTQIILKYTCTLGIGSGDAVLQTALSMIKAYSMYSLYIPRTL